VRCISQYWTAFYFNLLRAEIFIKKTPVHFISPWYSYAYVDHDLDILSKLCRYTASEDPASAQFRHVPCSLRHALHAAPLPGLKCIENKIYSSLIFIFLITLVLRRVLPYTARKQGRWVRNQLGAWMYVYGFCPCSCCPLWAKILWRADLQSRVSCRMSINMPNLREMRTFLMSDKYKIIILCTVYQTVFNFQFEF
jgi:hypothetical protein